MASDLATTALLATNKAVMIAPAMNPMMWNHPATQANITTLHTRGIRFVGPHTGDMACGEQGKGRMAEPAVIVAGVVDFLKGTQPLKGKKALVTAGPTMEPIDPVRYISNHSSGKQGYAIAEALSNAGAEVTLISGPTKLAPPPGLNLIPVNTADEMLTATQLSLPVDIAIFAAAVADWKIANAADQKMKKKGRETPALEFTANPDILATIAQMGEGRPELVIGFAAETENLILNAKTKLQKKSCDWILANDVSEKAGTFGGDSSEVHWVGAKGAKSWGHQTKEATAKQLVKEIAKEMES
jgi:phosphopantothenoylcysteine decarboxylase/phosphopantothenate--cysteine ligase